MSIFWKGFAIFWIIFLIWYLTGGPQRVTINGASPTTTFNSTEIGNIATSSDSNTNNTSSFSSSNTSSAGENFSIQQPQIKSDKSFSTQQKTNTINVAN